MSGRRSVAPAGELGLRNPITGIVDCCARRGASWYGDDAHLSVDQVRRERRQTIVVSVHPPVFDRDIAALHKPGLGEALVERRIHPAMAARL